MKKISRRDMAKMSGWQLTKASIAPYKRLFSYLRPYKVRFIAGLIFGALYASVNGLLLPAVHFISAIVFPGIGDTTMKFGSYTLNLGNHGQPTITQVALASAVIPAIMLLRGLFGYLNSYCMLWTSNRVLNDIRQEVFAHILDQSLTFFNRAKTGELIQVVFNQTRMAQTALTTIASDAIKQPLTIISVLVSLFIMDWRFTLTSLLLFPVCIVPVALVGRKVRKMGAKEEEEAASLMVVMQEAFAGVRVVKSYAREPYEKERFGDANETMLRLMLRWQKAMEMIGPVVEFLASFGIALALVYCWFIGLKANTFTALSLGLVLLYPPFKTMSRIHILMQKCLAATTKIFEMIDTAPEIQDAPNAKRLKATRGEIAFENVTFSYQGPKGQKMALENVSLNIEPGKTYALVGPSGAGKTTMLALLLRFYDPTNGRILIDGKDVREYDQRSLRSQIGIVSQETFLFHDTIYKNILYGRLEATEEEVYEAARQAYADAFIREKPHAYQTVIGDKGSLLSGGQQQRLSIARALLKNAPILLLDEATSALDSESEQKIQLALDRLSTGRTVIAIAHRLSTILKADQIVVMKDGLINEVGTHSELYDRSTLYRKLYDLQFHRHDDSSALSVEAAALL